ncbi:hypothetical protein H6G96_38450 [Nostoc sp. FACHB-892]|uniref:hypothetical protein n=1 Tax=Nostoc sp. FACHB-892 TaxID=2692843 RepID=UPI00168841BA|nr:hypothetical protein [Nostoc sp. FACHB-892]MBD2731987.1 hypothetical protein [Nostoc sp. FACHB-892]
MSLSDLPRIIERLHYIFKAIACRGLHHRPNSYAYYFSVANSYDRAPKLHDNDSDLTQSQK